MEAEAADRVPSRPVAHVADDRVAELRQLDADLVAPARAELDREARHVGASLEDAVPRDGDARAPALGRRPGGVGGADAKGALLDQHVAEHALVRLHDPLDDRDVAAVGVPRRELALETSLRLGRLRDDQEARGLAVEPVDDERPARWPRALQIRPHHAVGGALALVLGPDREEAGRLLDHEERVVLVDQAKRLGESGRRRRAERDTVVRGHRRPRVAHDLAADPYPPGHQPRLQAPPRRVRELRPHPLQQGHRHEVRPGIVVFSRSSKFGV